MKTKQHLMQNTYNITSRYWKTMWLQWASYMAQTGLCNVQQCHGTRHPDGNGHGAFAIHMAAWSPMATMAFESTDSSSPFSNGMKC